MRRPLHMMVSIGLAIASGCASTAAAPAGTFDRLDVAAVPPAPRETAPAVQGPIHRHGPGCGHFSWTPPAEAPYPPAVPEPDPVSEEIPRTPTPVRDPILAGSGLPGRPFFWHGHWYAVPHPATCRDPRFHVEARVETLTLPSWPRCEFGVARRSWGGGGARWSLTFDLPTRWHARRGHR